MNGLGWTFDTVAEEYDKWRPEYIDELYKDIFSYCNLCTESKALEIGIGTGQATRPFLDTGCNLTAVEPGKNLVEIVRKKFENYSSFSIVNSSFQSYEGKHQSFDLVYSASAFHWIEEKFGYEKVYSLLKTGVVFARFSSHPFYNIEGQERLYEQMQQSYFKHMPNPEGRTTPKPVIPYTVEDAVFRSKIAEKYGFTDIQTKVYYRDLVYNSDDYIKRLAIESDKIALDADKRARLLCEIKMAVDNHGGTIIVRDMIELNLGRKEEVFTKLL